VKLDQGEVAGAIRIDSRDVNPEILPFLPYMKDDVADIEARQADCQRIDGRKVELRA